MAKLGTEGQSGLLQQKFDFIPTCLGPRSERVEAIIRTASGSMSWQVGCIGLVSWALESEGLA